MEIQFPLTKIIRYFSLELICAPEDLPKRMIGSVEINRPGLPLAGFYGYFDPRRIQLIGRAEYAYLMEQGPQRREEIFNVFFAQHMAAVILTCGNRPTECMIAAAKRFDVPLLATKTLTSHFTGQLVDYLNEQTAPTTTLHGVLVNVYGEGVLLLGDSGVGKSETAIELVKRGHRLIADDAVIVRRTSPSTLIGSSPKVIRHLMELRGIGIVDIRRIFGVGSVMRNTKVELVIQLEMWDSTKAYDRLGMDREYYDILDVSIRTLTIPVKPGRNLAAIIEVAAINNREEVLTKRNAAQELNQRILSRAALAEGEDDGIEEEEESCD